MLASWPTGAAVDLEEAMRYQRAMPAPQRFAEALAGCPRTGCWSSPGPAWP